MIAPKVTTVIPTLSCIIVFYRRTAIAEISYCIIACKKLHNKLYSTFFNVEMSYCVNS